MISATEKRLRDPRLDGIRGIAIGLVLLGHATAVVPGAAVAGVDLFFVLSGYLITRVLLQERDRSGSIGVRSFWSRRMRRLLPGLLAFLTAYALFAVIVGGPGEALRLRSIASSVLYVSNWTQALGHHSAWELGHTWSLAMEEQFYMLWPPVLALLMSMKMRRDPTRYLIGAIAFNVALRAALHAFATPLSLYYAPVTWADSLMIGCVLSLQEHRRPSRRPSKALVVLAAIVVTVIAFDPQPDFMFLGGTTALALGWAVLLNAMRSASPGSVLERKPLRELGLISYGVYLWHVPLLFWSTILLRGHIGEVGAMAVGVSGSIVLAEVSYRFIESRFATPSASRRAVRSPVPAARVPVDVGGRARSFRPRFPHPAPSRALS